MSYSFEEEIIFDSVDNFYAYLKDFSNILICGGSGKESEIAQSAYAKLQSSIGNTSVNFINIPSGEEAKSNAVLNILWDMFSRFNLDRNSLVVSVGGGSVSDVVGFAAATYYRGVSYISIPTTLLSIVDASIGGKRAVNTSKGKNLIGCFYSADKVFVDLSLLKTLEDEEFASGMFEVIKICLISGNKELYLLKDYISVMNNDKEGEAFKNLIFTCMKNKQKICKQDYYDKNGIRASLNYGHTLAHAIEHFSINDYVSHGLAVAFGMDFAAKTFSDKNLYLKQKNILNCFSVLDRINNIKSKINESNIDDVLKYVKYDKKSLGDKINFVYLKDFGDVTMTSISLIELKKSLLQYIKN